VDVSPALTGASGEIWRITPDGRDELVESIAPGRADRIGAMCASTTRLAWTTAHHEREELHVRDLRTGTTRHLPLNSSTGATYLGCGNGFVVWAGGTGSGDSSQ
jgi:hypothetical protein